MKSIVGIIVGSSKVLAQVLPILKVALVIEILVMLIAGISCWIARMCYDGGSNQIS